MTNLEKFHAAYFFALSQEVANNPERYSYGPEKIPEVVDRMVQSYTKAPGGNIGPAFKKAAKACGIKPTLTAVREWLNADMKEDQFKEAEALEQRADAHEKLARSLRLDAFKLRARAGKSWTGEIRIQVIGRLWNGAKASYEYRPGSSPSTRALCPKISGPLTRESVYAWVDQHAGDFQNIQDFSVFWNDQEIIPWKDEVSEKSGNLPD